MLGLDGEFGRLGFGHRRVRPQLVENVELEIAAQRFLDHGAVRDAGARCADLDPLQNVFVDRERRTYLGHKHILPSRCGDATMRTVNRRPKEDVMESTPLLDCAGRRRSPATTSSFHQGLTPRNKGLRYPPDPPTVEEIVAVMRAAGGTPEGVRLRGIIVVLWRAGLRISEALALTETDLDPSRGSLVVRHGKGDKRREVGMDRWA